MNHFKTEQWIDFVNEIVCGDTKQEMEKHLAQGCEACHRTILLWRKVRNAANAEKHYEPPADALRVAKTSFFSSILGTRRKQACTWAEVLFDNFLQPAVQGTRSAGSGARHMLYRADPYQIDVQIENGPDRRTLVITGQVLDLRQSGLSGRRVLVVISNLRGQVVRASTNDSGEFRSEIPDSGNLELVFPGLTDKPVIIVLRDPLGESSAATQTSLERKTPPRSGRKPGTRRSGLKKT